VVYRRNPSPKGPMTAFGYSYLEDQLSRRQQSSPALLHFEGLWGAGADYAYETLNLVDGKRTLRQIRDDLAAIYGPVPLAQVAGYLDALERIGVVSR
jgi:aminopeptidase YwaD